MLVRIDKQIEGGEMGKQQKEFTFDGKTYKIESGIAHQPVFPYTPWKALYKSMNIGDSILLTRREATNFICSINSWVRDGKAKTGKMSMRKVDKEHARVWKIK